MIERDSMHSHAASNGGGDDVQRDMDLVRAILLQLERRETSELLGRDELKIEGRTDLEVGHHLNLLFDAGMLIAEPVTTPSGRVIYVHAQTLSWAGHEFLDNVRDPEIWRQTKAGAVRAGQWSLKTLADIAVSIGKARIEHLFATGQIGG